MSVFPTIFSCLLIFTFTIAFDESAYALYDLVEELNINFYEFLNIPQNAESADVRKAYRALSKLWHPDKNKESDAEEKFRKLAAVYEVLKDSVLRERYNYILEYGLPDWKQPVYYYRKVRKFGFLEILLLLGGIFTVGYFLVVWAAYLERKFEIEEVIRSSYKRKDKNRRNRRNRDKSDPDEEMENAIQEIVNTLERPQLYGILPLVLLNVLIRFTRSTPVYILHYCQLKYQEILTKRHKRQHQEQEMEEEVCRNKGPRVNDCTQLQCLKDEPVLYNGPRDNHDTSIPEKKTNTIAKDGPWTDGDLHNLAIAVAKYPGGTPGRWDRISEMVQRPVNDVLAQAKNSKDYVKSIGAASQGITGKLGESCNLVVPTDGIITTRTETLDMDTKSQSNITLKRNKTYEPTDTLEKGSTAEKGSIVSKTQSESQKQCVTKCTVQTTQLKTAVTPSHSSWTQTEQKVLELALQQYPKGCEERWDKIAGDLPNKTKEDCMARYKYLAEVVKRKKESSKLL